jgi:hypothetical protein
MTTTKEGADPAAARTPVPPPERRPGDQAEAPQPASAPGPAAEPLTSGLPQLVRLVGTVVAPTTLLTSLLFFFGWSQAYHFYDYFGVNTTLLDLTTRDYVQKAADGLFLPLTVLACAGLLALWGHSLLRARLAVGAHPRALRLLTALMAIGGLILAVGGLWSFFAPTVLHRYLYGAAPPLSLAVGVLLLMYAVHLWRSLTAEQQPAGPTSRPAWAAVAEWGAVFVLVGLSLFWAANDYSVAVGRGRAAQMVAALPREPSVVIFSERSLSLDAPGVREMRCKDPEASYRFRYDGLKLLPQSSDQYLFLPETWSRRRGVAILIPRSESLRLELIPASARGTLRRSAC